MATTMTVQCPSCDTAFPVDPEKVPEGGVRTQCTVCETFFRVDRPDAEPVTPPAPEAAAAEEAGWDTSTEETSWETSADQAGVEPPSDEPPSGAALSDDAPSQEDSEESLWDGSVGEAAEASTEETHWDAASSETRWDTSPELIDEVSGLEPVGAFGAEEVDSEDMELPVLEGTEVHEEPDHPDVALEAALEPEVEEVEPLEAMEAGDVEDGVLESTETSEAGPQDDWSNELGDDWVLETEDLPTFEEADVEVERLDTVEEQLRSIQDQERYEGYMGMGDEVMLTPEELDAPIAEPTFPEPAPPEPVFPEAAPPEPAPAEPAAEAPPATGFQFGRRDPHEKARRLARVLVSDMITYNPERHARALDAGSLREDFDEEIQKSWSEYVEQVGHELAESTPYWSDALNEILAKGEPLF